MSDEESCDDSMASKEEWKKQMAKIGKFGSGFKGEFLEVIEASWRSPEVSTSVASTVTGSRSDHHSLAAQFNRICKMLDKIHAERTKQGSIPERYQRIRGGRKNDAPPESGKFMPFDFCIDSDWLERMREDEDLAKSLEGWGSSGNPDGYDAWTAKLNIDVDAPGEGAGAGGSGVDSTVV